MMGIQIFIFLESYPVLAKKYRLKGKDVIFLSRRRQYISAGLFGFFYWKQYVQFPFHQISFHVTIKYSKRSNQRNVVKRAVAQHIQDKDILHKPLSGGYYKIFIVLNKAKVEELQKKIANFQKKDIIRFIQNEFASSRNRRVKNI